MATLCPECLEIECECYLYTPFGKIRNEFMRSYIMSMVEGSGSSYVYRKLIDRMADVGYQPIDFRQPEEGEIYISPRYPELEHPIVNATSSRDAAVFLEKQGLTRRWITFEATRDEVVILEAVSHESDAA